MSTASVIVLIVYAVALIGLGYWDLRRTFSRVERDRRPHVDPMDFSQEIRVTRGDRRGPEPIENHGRKRVGL